MQVRSFVGRFIVTAVFLSATFGFSSGAPRSALTLNILPANVKSVSSGETIVYIKGDGRELRLIQPDGSNDRLLWRVPESAIGSLIGSVEWRPDARQLAFTSKHEATCSEFVSDVYLINPDGSHLRRLTNAPACAELANYPQGSASVNIQNLRASPTDYLVYIEGAPTAKLVSVPSNTSLLVSFPLVADLGPGVLQGVVAGNGTLRWIDTGISKDVTAGQNTHLGTLVISGAGFDFYGASLVSWAPLGDRLAYQLGQGRLWQVSLNAPILSEGGPLLHPSINSTILATRPRWSTVSNDAMFQRYDTSPRSIWVAAVDGTDKMELASVTFMSGLDWFNDGSGFVVSDDDSLFQHTDLYTVTFGPPASIGQLTNTIPWELALEPSMSPDDGEIVYVYFGDIQSNPTSSMLRIMNSNGTGDRLLIAGGRAPDWSRVAPSNPPEFKAFLPLVQR